MTADRLLDLVSLLVLACVGIAGVGRALFLALRGVWVLPIDRQRSPAEGLLDLVSLLVLAGFLWESFATAVAPGGGVGPGPLREIEVPWPTLRWLGLPPAAVGVALYIRALRDFGGSWRFTIDRERPGGLVTKGIFALTRNPVYLALLLVAGGVAVALGDAFLLLLAGASFLYFRHLIQREEHFLALHYGDAYARYRESVPRWLRWPVSAPSPRHQP